MQAEKTWQLQEVKSLLEILRSAPFCLDELELPEREAEEMREISF
jgi:hypothetical protein